jgi:hypothetical protein
LQAQEPSQRPATDADEANSQLDGVAHLRGLLAVASPQAGNTNDEPRYFGALLASFIALDESWIELANLGVFDVGDEQVSARVHSLMDELNGQLGLYQQEEDEAWRIFEHAAGRRPILKALDEAPSEVQPLVIAAIYRTLESVFPSYTSLLGRPWPLSTYRAGAHTWALYPRQPSPLRNQSSERTVSRWYQRTREVRRLVTADLCLLRVESSRLRVSLEQHHEAMSPDANVLGATVGGSCVLRNFERGQLVEDRQHRRFTVRDPSDSRLLPALTGVMDQLTDGTSTGKVQAVKVIVLPELTQSANGEVALTAYLSNIRFENRRPWLVVAGSRHEEDATVPESGPRHWNVAQVLNGRGEPLWRHRKLKPASFREQGEPGDEAIRTDGHLTISDSGLGRVAVLICADLESAGVLEAIGDLEVDLLLVPTMNPGSWQDSLYGEVRQVLGQRSTTFVFSQNTCAPLRRRDVPTVGTVAPENWRSELERVRATSVLDERTRRTVDRLHERLARLSWCYVPLRNVPDALAEHWWHPCKDNPSCCGEEGPEGCIWRRGVGETLEMLAR